MKTATNTTILSQEHNLVPKTNLVMIIVVIVLLSLFKSNLSSANIYKPKLDSLTCLEIEGKIINSDEGQDKEYTIELITNDGNIDTMLLNNKSKFKFNLNKDSYYVIRISRKGYISKLVSVNTEILGETDAIYRFIFETSLLKEEAVVHLNKDVTDMPIAIIYFDYDSDAFVYNKKYTDKLKKEMRKSKSFNKNSTMSTGTKVMANAYSN